MSGKTNGRVLIEFDPPKREAPGYLKRVRTVVKFQQAAREGELTAELFDQMVAFAAQYVVALDGKKCTPQQAEAALWDLSEEQWEEVQGAIAGGGLPLVTSDKSDEPSPEEAAPPSPSGG